MQVLYSTLEILSLPPEDDEDMSLGKTTKDFINQEIAEQVGAAIDKFNPHGWRLVTFWLRQLGPIAATVAIFITLIIFAATQFNLANTRLAKQAVFESDTKRDLDSIKLSLQKIEGGLAKQTIIDHASLPLADFKETLPELDLAIKTAQDQKLSISPVVLTDLKQKLSATTASAPSYWTAVAAIVNYMSFVDQVNHRAPDPATVAHPCGGMTAGSGGFNSYAFTTITGCVIDLDSTQNNFSDLTFKNAVIRYHGGKVALSNITFINCRFVLDIPVSAPTNPERNRFLMTLLNAPDTKAITFPSSTGA